MFKKYKFNIVFSLLLLVASPILKAQNFGDLTQPNVIIFYVDDLGWQDTELNMLSGDTTPAPSKTPNVLDLAADGINFQQGYSPAPTCSPSRVALMSGKHPARSGKTHVIGGGPPTPISINATLVSPFWPGRMDYDEYTIAEALGDAGYYTGHVGKWHCAISHNASPLSNEQGFEYMNTAKGVATKMTNILSGFGTVNIEDPYQLQDTLDSSYGAYAGLPARPFDATTQAGLDFMADSVAQSRPFFLYMSHWMVHTPIHTRDEALLEYYCDVLGHDYDGTATPNISSDDLAGFVDSNGKWKDPNGVKGEGQKNPFYAAMVDTVDWSLGELIDYLKATNDPRHPGYKLYDTTYIFFTSDNGGMEGSPTEHITDNAPLDRGKISSKEGGVRVPFVVAGPSVRQNVESQELINGLDLYPTLLAISGASGSQAQNAELDGVNVLPYLLDEANRINDTEGSHRNTLYWHFPNSSDMTSSIRDGDYKLYKNYKTSNYSLYRLYNGTSRVDWEEDKNLTNNAAFASVKSNLINNLENFLTDLGSEPAYNNAASTSTIANKGLVPDFLAESYNFNLNRAYATYETSGKANVQRAYMYYTTNGGDQYEEWFQIPATVEKNGANNPTGRIFAEVPAETTHYVFNLIDENNFLRSRPDFNKNSPYSEQTSAFDPNSSQVDLGVLFAAIGYDAESGPGDNTSIIVSGSKVGKINGGSWIRFDDFNFGAGAETIKVNAGSGSLGGNIQIRVGSLNTPLRGVVRVNNTGGWNNFVEHDIELSEGVSGIQDFYFVFVGSANYLMTLESFQVD